MASPLMRRTVSSQSASGGSNGTPDRARRARQLREFYGLSSPNPQQKQHQPGDPLTMDNPSFDARARVEQLLSNSSLEQLVDEELELVQSIRELDSEKQSLVYNHHHELISASETIKQLQGRAVQLDHSLDKLKQSFERIQQLDAGLRLSPIASTDSVSQATTATTKTARKRQALGALVDLPRSLEALPVQERASLWGQWEPVLAKWDESGVRGVKDIGQECRAILRADK